MLLLFGLAKMKFILSLSKLNETEIKIFRNLCPETKLGHANVCGNFIALQLVPLKALPHQPWCFIRPGDVATSAPYQITSLAILNPSKAELFLAWGKKTNC